MKPAFLSGRHAAAFAILLGFLLALPAVCGLIFTPKNRPQAYGNIPNYTGEFRWVQSQIYGNAKPVDIAFIGSSRMMFGVDAEFVQTNLTAKLGRPANVLLFGWAWAGFDTVYYVARDLLNTHPVHTVVICDEYFSPSEQPELEGPQARSPYWFRWGEKPDTLVGLPLIDKLRLYAVATLGAPRQLVNLIRNDPLPRVEGRGSDLITAKWRGGDVVQQRGSVRTGMNYPDGKGVFVPYSVTSAPNPLDAVTYSRQTANSFDFSGPVASLYQAHFAQLVAKLCKERGVQLIYLHLPMFGERSSPKVPICGNPEELFQAQLPILGFPGEKLFAGVADQDFQKLFVDRAHLNKNGSDLFMPAITPGLISLYEHAE